VLAGQNPNEFFVGSANGGVWRSTNVHETTPHWANVLDGQKVRCTSISALTKADFDPNLMFAGCGGSTSSEMGYDWSVLNDGDWGGVMRSTDAGKTWSMTGFPVNFYVTAVVPISKTVIAVSARANFFSPNDGGVWLTQDGGASWKRTLNEPVFDLLMTKSSKLLFAAVAMSAATVRVSADAGATWTDFSEGISWEGGSLPFYPCLAAHEPADQTKSTVLFVGGLAVSPTESTNTSSAIFWREVPPPGFTNANAKANAKALSDGSWTTIQNQPQNLDGDAMPKDR
jgi:hypothetical protein